MLTKRLQKRPEVLPEGWEAKKMDGKIVYVNHVTKETQWEKPTTAEATRHDALNNTNVEPSAAPSASYGAQVDGPPRKSSSNRKKEDLPSGWRKAKTKEGETLYVNDIEKITSWDPPVAIAPPATVPQHGSEGRVDHGRRPSTRSSTSSTASNSAPDEDEESAAIPRRRRPSTGIDTSGGRHERTLSSSSGRRGSNSSSGSRRTSTRDERGKEPGSPLPRGWSKDYTKTGRLYYRNDHDQTTTWEKPTAEASAGESDARKTRSGGGSSGSSGSRDSNGRPGIVITPGGDNNSSDSSLPEGWSTAFTKSGKPYYRNDHDKTTSWDRPTEASIPPAATADGSGRSAGRSNKVKEEEKSRPKRISSGDQHARPTAASHRRSVTNSGSSSNDRLTKASLTAANLAPGSPLPSGWSKAVTKSGETYYRNDHDQTTTWDRPTEAPIHAAAVDGSGRGSRSSKSKGEDSRPARISSGETQEQPLPPGWSQDVTANGDIFYRNHIDKTTSWDRPVMTSSSPRGEAPRPRASRRQSASAVKDGAPPALPTRTARGSSTGDLHAQQKPPSAPAPVVFDPTMFGIPPGTQVPPQLQATLMQQQQMMQGLQQPGQQTGMPMGMPGMFGGAQPTSAMGKGMNFLMKRMTEPPTVKPPPKGYVGLGGGSFTNFGGLNASALKAPKKKKKPEKEEEPSSMGDRAGNYLVKKLNKGINSGLGAVGVGDVYKVKLKKKKKGGLKWGGKGKLPGLGSGSSSDSSSESGGDVDVDFNIDINACEEQPEEGEEEEGAQEEEEDDD